jgi:chromosome segregation ATPase
MDTHTKEKIKLLLEEKSLLEDEIVSIATLARNYQSQAKLCKEELEKLESSYHSICSQNSQLESELIRLNAQLQETDTENRVLKSKLDELSQQFSISQSYSSQHNQNFSGLEKNSELEQKIIQMSEIINQVNEECEELKGLCSEKNEEILALREIVDKDKKNEAIKELSYIILSKEHNTIDSPIKNIKYNYPITDVLESKIKSLEQESQEYLSKYRSVLFKYIECLKESLYW